MTTTFGSVLFSFDLSVTDESKQFKNTSIQLLNIKYKSKSTQSRLSNLFHRIKKFQLYEKGSSHDILLQYNSELYLPISIFVKSLAKEQFC